MKYLKHFLIILLIFSFALVSCKKDSTTGSTSGSIDGTWNVVDLAFGFLLTTNSNQVVTAIPGWVAGTNIPANTPTFVQFLLDSDDFDGGISTINFENDGTGTVTTIDDDGTENENFTYTTDGDQLTINENGEITVFEYSIDGSTLTLTISEDWCAEEDYATQAECFTDAEDMFDLTPGSITAVSMQVEFILDRAVAKQGLNAGKTYNLMNPYKAVNDFKKKVKKMRESL